MADSGGTGIPEWSMDRAIIDTAGQTAAESAQQVLTLLGLGREEPIA